LLLRSVCSSFAKNQWYNASVHEGSQRGTGVDAFIRLIESIAQSIIGIIQPLFENGSLGYVVPFLLLVAASVFAVTGRNRANLAGYMLGWLVSIAVIGLYLETRGDSVLANLTGNLPRADISAPLILGFLLGFMLLAPFIRMRLGDAVPIIITLTTVASIVVMFMTFRSSAMITVIESQGVRDLITYRKRYCGVLALAFGAGVLLHVVISAANTPQPVPARKRKQY
jgi:hypothetical protein